MYINQSERAFLGYPSWQYGLVNICVQFFFINTGGFYMPVVRVNKTKDYTVMSNYHLRETNMSLKAKGLLSLMLSLHDNWDYSVAGLVAICKENETSIKSALKELDNFGYLRVTKLLPNKDDNRTTISYIYDIFEKPLENQGVDYQGVGFLGVDNLGLENQGQLNTNKLNTNKLNTNNTHIPKLPLPKISVSENFGTENLDTNNNNYKNNNYYNNNNITHRNETEKFDCQKVADAFNETCVSLPRVTKLTDKRKKAIKSILKKHSFEELKNIFKKVEYSSFLNGSSGKWYGATFDWLLKESNLIKVIEGNYDDKGKYNNFHGTPSYDIDLYESETSDNYENYLNSFANK